jgi:hypothetical protein
MTACLRDLESLKNFLLILKEAGILLQKNNFLDRCGFWRSLADNSS